MSQEIMLGLEKHNKFLNLYLNSGVYILVGNRNPPPPPSEIEILPPPPKKKTE